MDNTSKQQSTQSSTNTANQAEQAHTHYRLAGLNEKELCYTNALSHYREAAALQPQNPRYLNGLGYFLDKMALHDEAIATLEKALPLLGGSAEHVELKGTINNNLGSAWEAKGQYDKAIDYYQKALDIDLNVFGAEYPNTAIDYNNLGLAWDSKGQYDKAIEYYQKALDINLKAFGAEHPKVATGYNNLGSAYYQKGDYKTALEYFEAALPIRRKFLGDDHPNTKNTAEWLTDTREKPGNAKD